MAWGLSASSPSAFHHALWSPVVQPPPPLPRPDKHTRTQVATVTSPVAEDGAVPRGYDNGCWQGSTALWEAGWGLCGPRRLKEAAPFRDQRGLCLLTQWYPACPGKRDFELKLAPAAPVSSALSQGLLLRGPCGELGSRGSAEGSFLLSQGPGRNLLTSSSFWVCPSLIWT